MSINPQQIGVGQAVVGTGDNGGVSEVTRRRPNKRSQKERLGQNAVVGTICMRQKSKPSTLLGCGKRNKLTLLTA